LIDARAPWIAALLIGVSGAASAQLAPAVQQVSQSEKSVTVEPIAQAASREVPVQLSSQRESRPAESQLTAVGSSRGQPTQLSDGPPSAQPPQALSRVAEGRTGAIDRVEGPDRCDAKLPKDKQPGDCSRVIENRAADFARPSPTQLSPEQKLLLDQQLQTENNAVADATRRLAASGQSDNSIESLAVASIALGQGSGQPAEQPAKEADPAMDPATQAVLQILSSIPPPQN
jgi:hypothetical protein